MSPPARNSPATQRQRRRIVPASIQGWRREHDAIERSCSHNPLLRSAEHHTGIIVGAPMAWPRPLERAGGRLQPGPGFGATQISGARVSRKPLPRKPLWHLQLRGPVDCVGGLQILPKESLELGVRNRGTDQYCRGREQEVLHAVAWRRVAQRTDTRPTVYSCVPQHSPSPTAASGSRRGKKRQTHRCGDRGGLSTMRSDASAGAAGAKP